SLLNYYLDPNLNNIEPIVSGFPPLQPSRAARPVRRAAAIRRARRNRRSRMDQGWQPTAEASAGQLLLLGFPVRVRVIHALLPVAVLRVRARGAHAARVAFRRGLCLVLALVLAGRRIADLLAHPAHGALRLVDPAALAAVGGGSLVAVGRVFGRGAAGALGKSGSTARERQ